MTVIPKPKAHNAIVKKDGVEAYGLYLELVRYRATTPDKARLYDHVRLLLTADSVSVSQRQTGRKQAKWSCWKHKSYDEAKAMFEAKVATLIGSPNVTVEVRGEPVLVQLTAVDVEMARRGEAPYARYSGSHYLEKKLGKIDDNMWRPTFVAAPPMPITIPMTHATGSVTITPVGGADVVRAATPSTDEPVF